MPRGDNAVVSVDVLPALRAGDGDVARVGRRARGLALRVQREGGGGEDSQGRDRGKARGLSSSFAVAHHLKAGDSIALKNDAQIWPILRPGGDRSKLYRGSLGLFSFSSFSDCLRERESPRVL